VRSAVFVALTLAALGGSMLTAPPAPAAPRILSFLPAADTTVRADQPTATGGSETSLAADNSPVRYSFMRFTISGVGSDIVESAKLRLYVTDAASVGGVFSRVANTTWSESTMNWNSAPPADSTPLATLGAITAATWYEVDLSTLVTGDGQFGIRIATPTSNKISFRSKEGKAGFRPELVVTVAPSTDVATPTASITVPSPGATVNGSVNVGVDAADDVGVVGVDLQVDGQAVGTDSSAPYVIPWDSSSVANGAHELTAIARDAVGNAGTSQPVAVLVDNVVDVAPPTAPTGLVATATGPTRVELSWTASQDDVGVAGYVIVRDDAEIESTAGITYVDDGVSAEATYRYTVVAVDPSGNRSDPSEPAEVTTPSAPPTPASFTFAAAGDAGTTSRAVASLAALDASATDFFLMLGDLDYDETPTDAAWCDWVRAGLPNLGPAYPFEIVAGNHEDQNGADGYIMNHAACLPDRLGATLGVEQDYGAEYYFDYPMDAPLMRVFMISPDLQVENVTYGYGMNDVHYRWLSDSIDAARAEGIRWIVVGMHYPCISASNSGCPIGQPLFNLLLQKKVDLVLGGHHHNYQRSKQLALAPGTCPSFVLGEFDQDCVANSGAGVMDKGAGTVVQVVGTFGRSGSSIKPDDPELPYFATTAGAGNGIMTYTVTPDRLDATFVPSVGSVTDSFSISASGVPSGDLTPPTAPTNLVATPVGGDQVDLSWTQSTDAVGVDHYTIVRNGVPVDTTSGTTYLDGSLTPGSTYSYVVRAVDLAGNVSAASNTAVATTAPGSELTFAPTADATIRAGAPTTNYGTSSSLSIDSSPSEHGLMKFSVTGIGARTVATARLRLFNVGASDAGGVFSATSITSWTETGVTWDTAPAAVGTPVATLGSVGTNTWYEVDLSSLIRADGVYSLRITTPSNDGAKWTSRNGDPGFTPQLVVTLLP
jgi:chitodextrinase